MSSTEEKIRAQQEYCKSRGIPAFIPKNGRCPSCGRQIYYGISLKQAGSEMITSCPYCKHSFVN